MYLAPCHAGASTVSCLTTLTNKSRYAWIPKLQACNKISNLLTRIHYFCTNTHIRKHVYTNLKLSTYLQVSTTRLTSQAIGTNIAIV